MITMTDRKQDFSCVGFGADEYNLQYNTEEDNYYSTNHGPKVLTTMRNMFAERKTDDYELVYDVPGQSQQRLFRVEPRNQNFELGRHNNYTSPPPIQSQQIPQRIQQKKTSIAPPQPPPPEPEEEEEEDEDDSEDNRIVHQCPECSKKYTSERRLKHHIQVHKNADAYKCPKCGYCYQSPDSLRRHWKKTPNCDETLAKMLNIELGGPSTSSQPPPPPP